MSETPRGNGTEMVPRTEPQSLLNVIARAMEDDRFDVTKLEALLRMQRELVAEQARQEYSRAMSAAQGEMRAVFRDAANEQTRSRYAKLETIDDAIRPIYTRHGFALEFGTEQPHDPASLRVVCECSHSGGHTKHYELEAPPDMTGARGQVNKTVLHGMGSTISYLRRYLTTMIFNVVLTSEDDDGNAGGETIRNPADGMGENIERRPAPPPSRSAQAMVDAIEPRAQNATTRADLDSLERDDDVRAVRRHVALGRPQRDRLETILREERERIAAFEQGAPVDPLDDVLPDPMQQQQPDADATHVGKIVDVIKASPTAEAIERALKLESTTRFINNLSANGRVHLINAIEAARQARLAELGAA